MRFSWMLPACAVVVGAVWVDRANAQVQEQAPGQYPTQDAAPLDRNFGLPTFGMPGAEVPQPKTMAPENVPPPEPDLSGSTDLALPKRSSNPNPPGYETPLFTTSQGSTTTDDTTASSSDTTSSAGDTTSFDDGARR